MATPAIGRHSSALRLTISVSAEESAINVRARPYTFVHGVPSSAQRRARFPMALSI
jgi:hypothetical protein